MNRRNILVYVAGKYRGNVDENIKVAREYAIRLWELGFAVICPHLNTAHFNDDCKCEDQAYLDGDLTIVDRCDCLLLLPDWRESKGAVEEVARAEGRNIWCYESIDKLCTKYPK